ncbi:Cof-type HAD-IIB family hydrolase [Bacillus tianshenii]|nr:Cof-type HAD-IIB family hydrolase [Bacillus tianshenii]
MNDKVVFFDIDGTLLNEEKELPDSTKDAVQQLQNKGVHTVIATGRAPFMFAPLREELGIDSFVSFNGQYVSFHGEIIYKNALHMEEIRKLEEDAKVNQHPMVFLDHEAMKANEAFHPYIEKSMQSIKFEHPPFDPAYYHNREIYQALLFCNGPDEEEGYRSSYDNLRFIRWHDYSIDVLPQGGSKARGIQETIKRLNIPNENVYAFGDGLNDIEMLSSVGTGIAMGNAKDEAKHVSNHITKHVDEDGIWHGLKAVGLL